MARFDFILGKPFQETLEHDYEEMLACREAKAWKSTQVIAGSIIEAVLIDYIAGTDGQERPKTDPLKMTLADAINICKSEGVLTQRTSDMCSVIRSYRNLIHAGRTIREAEETPSQDSANIAVSLTDIILREVAKTRRDTYGPTADQVVSKLEADPNSLPILRLLIHDMHERERARLMLDVLPERYIELSPPGMFVEDWQRERLALIKLTYHVAHGAASEETRRAAMEAYVKVLREGHGELVEYYDEAFFVGADAGLLTASQLKMVKEHHLARMKASGATEERVRQFTGLETFLTKEDVSAWLDPILQQIVRGSAGDALRKHLFEYVMVAHSRTPSSIDSSIHSRAMQWVEHIRAQNKDAKSLSMLELLASSYEEDDLPF
jgi:hypothetical protein